MVPDGIRATIVKLHVLWDPEAHDHPVGWDWETLLETQATLLDFEDDNEANGVTDDQ